MALSAAYLVAVATVGIVLLYCVFTSSRRNALPPGPPRDPIIGNLRQMPSAKDPLVFHEWAETYGDVMYPQIPGQSIIVLDSLQAAEDLLDKRSAIYSDRPNFPLYELFGWTSVLTLLRYGSEKFAKCRQIHQTYLGRQNCVAFNPMQIREARTLVRNLYTAQPAQYENYLSRFATGRITQIVAGHTMSRMVLESLSRAGASPAGTAIDFFPFLQHFPRWFPGTYYAGVAEQWRPTVRELYEFPLRTVRAQREIGEAKLSFLLTQLEEMGTWESVTDENQEDLKANATTMFTAGGTTTWSALAIFVLAMVLHPECQLHAKEEIDSVIGPARLPEFGDRGNLSYVEAIVLETFNGTLESPWVTIRAVIRLQIYLTTHASGIPHRPTEDDTYRGMFIPAGTLVLANISYTPRASPPKGMTLDETIYSNPISFHPDRFLPKPLGGGEPSSPGNSGLAAVCTGQYLGENSVWIAIASILATCTITNAVDEHGEIIVPENEMSYGLTSHPKDFRCVIIPRNTQAEALVADHEALEF
ncbi:cytochrome P450 [Mycena vulgaris]|nr:cytochrome P450 [Mycena vulgaris]